MVGLSLVFPDRLSVEVHEFPNKEEFMEWLMAFREGIGAPGHRSSPFVWFEPGRVLGGCDDTIAWARNTFSLSTASAIALPVPNVDVWNPDVRMSSALMSFIIFCPA